MNQKTQILHYITRIWHIYFFYFKLDFSNHYL